MKLFLFLLCVGVVLSQTAGCNHGHIFSKDVKDFKASRAKHTASIITDQPIDKVFPLFSAEGEKKWIPGWRYINPMESTEMSEDFIFLVRLGGKSNDGKEDIIFIVKSYDLDEQLLELYRITPGDTFALYTIKSEALSDTSTKTTISLEQTATTEAGNETVNAFTAKAHEDNMAQWTEWIDAYFAKNRSS